MEKNKIHKQKQERRDKMLEKEENKSEEKEEIEKVEKIENSDEIIELKKQIESQKIQLTETDDRLKRIAAEFDNYKKRNTKERETMHSSMLADIVSGFLPILDNLEKAVEAQTEDKNYQQGVELVLKQFKDVLKANGVQEIETVGKTFDPELHEAVSSVVDETLGEKEIKEEYRKGYIIGNKVIRHSMVIVAN